MYKSTINSYWETQDLQDVQHPSKEYSLEGFAGPWLQQTRRIKAYLISIGMALQSAFIDKQILNYSQLVRMGYKGRENLPYKTWSRYSAYLVSEQKVKQRVKATVAIQEQQLAIQNHIKLHNNPQLSFQVKSVRTLPMWASALSEVELIEFDLHS